MILAVDVGTSSARASAYDDSGRALDGLFHRVPYEPAVARDGTVKHDRYAGALARQRTLEDTLP